jgi:hypothetical protein
MLAPEPYLSACLAVLQRATLDARFVNWGALASLWTRLRGNTARRTADLMDAVHNIPWLIQHWEECDQKLLRSTLEDYDRAWGGSLGAEYDRMIAAGG